MAAYQGGQRSAAKSPRKPKPPVRPTVRSSDSRTNLPGGKSKPKPKPNAKPQRQGPAVPARLAKAPPAPKLPAPTRTTVSRPVATRPAAKPKAPAKAKPTMAPKPQVAQTSGIGPLKSGAAYASQKGSISETTRQLREMRAASSRRQTGQAAPALSSSKDYSSQFKDLKGGSSRFTAELKKKKKLF
jgi:hypothetical protein